MKTAIFAIMMVTCFTETRGQSVFSNATNAALEKIIQDYPNRFSNIKGTLLSQDAQESSYESNVKIPGSLSCTISQTNNSNRKLLSWKAELFVTPNFSEASNRYAKLFQQIKNSVIRIQRTKPYILNGVYVQADENKNFQSILLNLIPASGEIQNVKVEISLESQSGKWKIQLAIYDDKDEQFVRNE